jgi:addiction module HigA family antidote
VKKKQTSCSPNYAIAPGETLRETLNALGMTRAELAKRTGRSLRFVEKILNAETAIPTEMAIKLQQVLKVPASFWINLEKNYQKNLSRLSGERNGQD